MRSLRPLSLAVFLLATSASPSVAQQRLSGNPVLPGWYADPEAHVFDGRYWIFPTYSAPYAMQTFMDAFSSTDLVTWEKHPNIIDTTRVKWARRAMWAPSIIQKDGFYYLFFGANDIQNDSTPGGIGVARSRNPRGPFDDYLGKPLIDKFHNGAQPIDQMVFKDVDGKYYIIYGGWRHSNIAQLNDSFTGFVPFPDGSTFKEITPKGFVEGSYMFVKDGRYYFMWSEGGWTGPDYAVAYAIGKTPFGPFERVGKILQQDSTVATGAGHHSIIHNPASDKWYIVYHRRPLGETDRNHRVVSIDEMKFDRDGFIQPVVITKAGVAPDPLRDSSRAITSGKTATDTLRLHVGSPEVNALFFVPHRARNSVYIGDAKTPTTTWTNELAVGDSAGMRVHRWVTKGTQANGGTWELQQTYNGRTLAPLKWAQRSSMGGDSRLVIDGTRVTGVLKGPGAAPPTSVDRTLPGIGFIASATDLIPMAVGLRPGLVMTAPVWAAQSTTVESRVFTVLREETVHVEGADVKAWRVEERVQGSSALKATWWLINKSPYMVLAEIPLANGQIQRITGVALD